MRFIGLRTCIVMACLTIATGLLPCHAQALLEADSLFEFAMITDIHMTSPAADTRIAYRNVETFVDYCNQTPNLQFAYFGGDFYNAYNTDHQQALWCMERAHNYFDPLRLPFYTTKGNHDCNGKCRTADRKPDNSQIIPDREYYSIWSPLSRNNPLYNPEGIVINPNEPEGNYYYRDFEKHRIRMILLNDYHFDSLEMHGYRGEQLKWLCEKALDLSAKPDRQEWGVVLFGHHLVGKAERYAVIRVLQAFQQGYDIVENDMGVYMKGNFKQQGPMQLIGFFHGHVHADIYSNLPGFNIIGVTRGFATDGEIDTKDELCFDHFVINTKAKTIYEHRTGHGQDRLFRYDQACRVSPIPVFEGAEGFAHFITGGNEGRVLTVKSLKDDGRPGTLRWAVEQEGARIIRFATGGEIKLNRPLLIRNDSLTIEGQSAPRQKEVLLTGHPVILEASEVVMRYLTIRPGEGGEMLQASEGLCGGLLVGREDRKQHNIILDHLTVSDARGDVFSCARCSDITVQFCRFERSLTNHGVLFGGFKSSYLNNYLKDLHTHSPLFPSTDGDQKWVDLQENVIENWGYDACSGGGHHGMINLTYNFFEPGPQSERRILLDVHPDGTGRYYLENNRFDGETRDWTYVQDRSGVPYLVSREDSAAWLALPPIQRPVEGRFDDSCLSIAMFPNEPLSIMRTIEKIPGMVKAEAGNTPIRTK